MVTLCFLSGFGQKIVKLYVSHSFVQKTIQKSDGSRIITSYFQVPRGLFKKQFLFISGNRQQKIVSKKYCFAHHDAEQISNSRYHNFCWVTLKSCHKNWTLCASHIIRWTVSMHSSSFDSVEILSREVKGLKLCK